MIGSTLRGRLTFAYAVLTAFSLTLLFAGVIALGVQRYIRSTMLVIDSQTAAIDSVVRAHRNEPDARVLARVAKMRAPAVVRVIIRDHRPLGAPPPPPAMAGFGGQHEPGGPPHDRSLGAIFHLHARLVFVHEGVIVITPAVGIESVLEIAAALLVLAGALAIVVSWSVGRWITRQAMEPLETVTGELQRFAAGDFTPILLRTTDRSELGALVTAFNGAAAQVVAAFEEREKNEQRLRLFLGEAGHEMRTPLTVLSAYLELFDRGEGDVVVPRAQLQTLRAETKRLRTLVERVMALARLEGSDQGRPELVDVTEVAKDAIAQVTALQPADVRLTASADDVLVVGEPWEVREAIGNLVDNAVRYGAGTPVDVSVALAHEEVVVRVSDGGPGISENDRRQMFRHFFRGEAAIDKTGSGLGLAIVARAAERLRGSVVLEDDPVRTVFRLTMPVPANQLGEFGSAHVRTV
jgi:signal transduction histidine kinase